MHDILESLRRGHAADARTRLAALAPALAITSSAAARTLEGPSARDASERPYLVQEGWARLHAALEPTESARLASAIEALMAERLPAVFVYFFDEVWALGEVMRARISSLVGHPYSLVNDAWAWQIAPGRERGWPPHRGISDVRLDRTAPEMINAWVALRDATAERSCMHAVALDEDPGYPDALDRVDAPLANVQAMPIEAGSALAWNANLLHWGGPCTARAAGPRVSCSFSLARVGTALHAAYPSVDTPALDFTGRIDVIARQIATYGEGKPDVGEEVLTWARATCTLSAHMGKLRARP